MSKTSTLRKWKILLLAFVCGMGSVLVANAAIDYTDQRMFCSQCHSMASVALTHQNSTHAQFSCNECHTPANLVQKLPYKAQVGLHDIYVTFTGTVPSTIHATQDMKEVVKANCIRCHSSTISTVAMDVKPFCVDCHKSVPHQPKAPIATKEAADV